MSNLLVISPSFKTAYVEKRKYDESKIVLFNNFNIHFVMFIDGLSIKPTGTVMY